MIKGLSSKDVKENRKKFGDNVIYEAPPETFWKKFKDAFNDPIIKILLGIAVIMSVIALLGYGQFSEIIGIIISVILVTFISARTEVASDREYRKLKKKARKETCKVYRDGKAMEINVDEVVVADCIILQSGDKIPADGILIQGSICVDNSCLNGETEECKKVATGKTYDEIAITGDTFVDKSSLFRGTIVVNGSGVMRALKTGMNTTMGAMANDMAEDNVESPLKIKLEDLANKISTFGYIGAIFILIALILNKIILVGGVKNFIVLDNIIILKEFLEALMMSIAIVVMAVPEGLPLMIALVLMKNTSKMLRNNILVRKSVGIETAGSLNILFSDKTGTITKGHLEVIEFFDGDIKDSIKDSDYIKKLLNLCIGKNTDCIIDEKNNIIGGNATDRALIQFLPKKDLKKYNNVKIINVQQFNSAFKYSAAQLNDITVYKGAPEKLLSKANKYITSSGEISNLNKNKINKKIDELASKSIRVLAFGYSKNKLIENTLPDDLIIVGFVCIRDDVRPEARKAIKEVMNAGVQVVMITGDRKETAVAISKDCGLLKKNTDVVLTSDELNKMSDKEVKKVLPNLRVIARALPTDKSRMVKLAQELNLVCGMTGDGVNDAPALKRADVGFAMGSGTDVAKEVSDIVILDDNFKSIKSAILYGRTIYNNILKFIKFQLSTDVCAVAVCSIGPFVGVGQPLGIAQILWINLIMDGLGALALGSEPAFKRYMDERPKSRTQSIISKDMIIQILTIGTWITILSFIFLKSPKYSFGNEKEQLTGYFCLFVLTAVFNGFNVRSEKLNLFDRLYENFAFIKIMGIIVIIQILLTKYGGYLFDCVPLTLNQWTSILLLAITIIPVDMIRKLITKKLF
ncbi:plasma-membrane calcium-translocating P-type ATPase [Clostridium cavendishii DSM 21758]|uniref:P-type Ca(2+) transporter n=1 Tax=Clostridium cavendishii DSM 21758 TaxID=1121302 RepID=A0A1M6HQS0_9CLOT|nr:calcium-translocating P-type ATPase, PMCA-type [Clostridium cavendishii]SHJ24503.1 plasma-membrane calcium-translocating P-type ATPase [Clostridium cavendishii DSM 21758]